MHVHISIYSLIPHP